MPPATMTSNEFTASKSCANIAAFIPEPHILFTVVQPAASGSPAPSQARRGGARPPARGRQHGSEGGLSRGCLALARGQYAAHEHFLHFVGPDARALHRGADRS